MLKIENRSTIRALRTYLEKIHLGEIMQSIRPSIPVEDPWPSYLHFKQSLARLPDGSIGLLYEGGAQQAYENIRLARFSLDWLAGGA